MRLKDQTVFVTGAGSGIGRAAALLASREGAAVACVDINEQGLKETVALAEGAGGRIDGSTCDILRRPGSYSVTPSVRLSQSCDMNIVCCVADIRPVRRAVT